MLVFYTWSIRLLADSIGLFGSVEKIGWLANHTPQEAGRLAPPTLPGGGSGGSAADAKIKRIAERKRGTAGVALPAAQVGAVLCCAVPCCLSAMHKTRDGSHTGSCCQRCRLADPPVCPTPLPLLPAAGRPGAHRRR
jgi:hypothetical protein